MKKRMLAWIMTACMVLSLLPVSALAVDDDPASGGKVNTATATAQDDLVTFTKTVKKVAESKNTFEITLEAVTKDTVTAIPAETSDIVLVIDKSASMDRDGRMEGAQAAANAFAEIVLAEDYQDINRIAVVSYNKEPGVNLFLTSSLTDVKNAVDAIEPKGGTNTQGGIHAAREILDNSTADHKVIVLLSDGEPQNSYRALVSGTWVGCEMKERPIIGGQKHDWNDGLLGDGYLDPETIAVDFDYSDIVGGVGTQYELLYLVDWAEYTATCTHGEEKEWSDSYFDNHGQPAILEADWAKDDDDCEIYSIYLGENDNENATETMSAIASENRYYNVAQASGLAELFKNLAGEITTPTEAGTVEDPMGQYVQLVDNSFSNADSVTLYTDGTEGFSWDWSKADPTKNNDGTKTYTLTYQVTLDVEADGFASDNPYHTNGDTVLTYYVGGEEKTLAIDGDETPTVSSLAAYTVTYNGNGATTGTVPTDPDSPYEDGSTVPVLGNTGELDKTNAVFLGWSTTKSELVTTETAEDALTILGAGGSFQIDEDTILYAVWAQDVGENGTPDYDETIDPAPTQITVTYKIVGGTWSDDTTDDKTETLTLTDGSAALGTTIPTGMKPSLGYLNEGSWNEEITGETTVSEDTTYTYTFEEDPVWHTEYNSIRVFLDDATQADFDQLKGAGSRQVRIYSDKFPVIGYGFGGWDERLDCWYVDNVSQNVTAVDIEQIALVRDQGSGPSPKIEIPMGGNKIYQVTVSEGTDAGTQYLRIDISKKNADPVMDTAYNTIRVYLDEGTKADFDALPGYNKDLRIYSDRYSNEVSDDHGYYRTCTDDYLGFYWTTNRELNVTGNDIQGFGLVKDQTLAPSSIIYIPAEGNDDYEVKFLVEEWGADSKALRVDITKKVDPNAVFVTYQIVGGTWEDGTSDSITVELTKGQDGMAALGNTIPTGMTASEGYLQSSGKWNVAIDAATKISADTTYTYTFEEDPDYEIWDRVYPRIYVYLDEGTTDDLYGLDAELSRQVRIYSDKYQTDGYRLCMPTMEEGSDWLPPYEHSAWWTANSGIEQVTARDITSIALAGDVVLGSSNMIQIPIEGNDTYQVEVTVEEKLEQNCLCIYITKAQPGPEQGPDAEDLEAIFADQIQVTCVNNGHKSIPYSPSDVSGGVTTGSVSQADGMWTCTATVHKDVFAAKYSEDLDESHALSGGAGTVDVTLVYQDDAWTAEAQLPVVIETVCTNPQADYIQVDMSPEVEKIYNEYPIAKWVHVESKEYAGGYHFLSPIIGYKYYNIANVSANEISGITVGSTSIDTAEYMHFSMSADNGIYAQIEVSYDYDERGNYVMHLYCQLVEEQDPEEPEPGTYTLTYNYNDASDSASANTENAEQKYATGVTATLKTDANTLYDTKDDGVVVVGWTKDKNNYTKSTPATEKPTGMVTSVTFSDNDIIVYAVWAQDADNDGIPDYNDPNFESQTVYVYAKPTGSNSDGTLTDAEKAYLEEEFDLTLNSDGYCVLGKLTNVLLPKASEQKIGEDYFNQYEAVITAALDSFTAHNNAPADVKTLIDTLTWNHLSVASGAEGYEDEAPSSAGLCWHLDGDLDVNAKYDLTFHANGGSFPNGQTDPLVIENLVAGTYGFNTTNLPNYAEPTHDSVDGVEVLLVGWTTENPGENAGRIYRAGDTDVPATVTQVTVSTDTQLWAVWGYNEDADTGDQNPDVNQIVITPADITIYTGGNGYEGVVNDSYNHGATNHGFPEPGYYITLPTNLNNALLEAIRAAGGAIPDDNIVDLSQYLVFSYSKDGVTREWALEKYDDAGASRVSDGRYIYRLMPSDDGTGTDTKIPVRLAVTENGTENIIESDREFTLAIGKLFEEYDMTIYSGGLTQNEIGMELTDTASLDTAFSDLLENANVFVDTGTLTVRGTSREEAVTEITSNTPTETVENITAVADADTKYFINDSELAVNDDAAAPSLLVDELAEDSGSLDALKQAAITENNAITEDHTFDFQYLDLVDANNGNAYLTLGEDDSVTIHWPKPTDAAEDTEFYVVHYDGLDRDFTNLESALKDQDTDIVVYSKDNTDNAYQLTEDGHGNLVFTTSTFSPFALVYETKDSSTDPDPDPDPDPGTTPGGGNQDSDYTLYYHSNFGDDKTFYQSDDDRTMEVRDYEDMSRLPDREGYEFVGWNTEEDGSGDDYAPGDEFRMTERRAHLYAMWERVLPDPDDTGVSRWLNTDDHDAYLSGYPDNTFGPDRSMTRAEVAQMFYALLLDKDVPITVTFSDVPADAWYAEAVNTLASLGMVEGYADGTFRPDNTITRAEFVTIAVGFADLEIDGEARFTDVARNAWYYPYIADACAYGWIGGYPDGSFRPDNTITRAEVTVIVNNMLGRAADERYVDRHEDELRQFGDLTEAHWAWYPIAEAVNSHDYTGSGATERWR